MILKLGARLAPRRLVWVLLLCLLASVTACADADATTDPPSPDAPVLAIEEWLTQIEGITAHEVATDIEGYRRFELTVTQPSDHRQLNGAVFQQRVILHHRDDAAPMVLASTGYALPNRPYLMEPTQLLNANQLMVEHRYFPPSIPANADWSLLNIGQAANDFHRIATLFRKRYKAAWVGAGASKGGMTALYHRRFFPADVDASVCYVTPMSFGEPDPRFQPYLQSINPNHCGEHVHELQRKFVLESETYAEALAEWGYTAQAFYPYSPKQFIERTASDFDWTFWQTMGRAWCESAEAALTSRDIALVFFANEWEQQAAPRDDITESKWNAYHYQALTELGRPEQTSPLLDGLITPFGKFRDFKDYPWGETPAFNPGPMRDVANWLASDAERMLFIYGEDDPWSGGAVELGHSADTLTFIAPAVSHGANIATLNHGDRKQALDALERWTHVAPRRTAVDSLLADYPKAAFNVSRIIPQRAP
jgi:hypothetical protein